MNQEKNKSYRTILRSTGIFGVAQIINILIGMIRNKLTVIILGSEGIGLISIYQSILDLIKSVSTLGIETSGIREIAQVKDNKEDLIITISAIRKWILIFSIIGTLICLLGSPFISQWIFGSNEYTLSVSLLSICVFFSILTGADIIILQGLRKLNYIVKAGILWNIFSLIITISSYWIWGITSIIPVFIAVNITTFLSYIYFSHKLNLKTKNIPSKLLILKGKKMLHIGSYVVLATIQTQLTLFLIKTFILNQSGLDDLGLVQATNTISNVYLTFILGVMGADFYPRLSSMIQDDNKVGKLINEQIYILILISTPVIVILLLVSKVVLQILYSSDFDSATFLLNWKLAAIFLKIISWVLGFTLLTKGKGFIFFITDTIFSVVYLICCYYLFPHYGLESIGISFLIGYIIYLITVYIATYKVNGFKLESSNLRNSLLAIVSISIAFYISQYQRNYLFYFGLPLTIIVVTYSIYKLTHILSIQSIINRFLRSKNKNE